MQSYIGVVHLQGPHFQATSAQSLLVRRALHPSIRRKAPDVPLLSSRATDSRLGKERVRLVVKAVATLNNRDDSSVDYLVCTCRPSDERRMSQTTPNGHIHRHPLQWGQFHRKLRCLVLSFQPRCGLHASQKQNKHVRRRPVINSENNITHTDLEELSLRHVSS